MPFPSNFFLLNLRTWNPCHSNLVMVSSLSLKCQGHPTKGPLTKIIFHCYSVQRPGSFRAILSIGFRGPCLDIVSLLAIPTTSSDIVIWYFLFHRSGAVVVDGHYVMKNVKMVWHIRENARFWLLINLNKKIMKKMVKSNIKHIFQTTIFM